MCGFGGTSIGEKVGIGNSLFLYLIKERKIVIDSSNSFGVYGRERFGKDKDDVWPLSLAFLESEEIFVLLSCSAFCILKKVLFFMKKRNIVSDDIELCFYIFVAGFGEDSYI